MTTHRDETHAASVTTLAIIAGGAGRRMGGPKHSLRIRGTPFLQSMLDRIRWPGPTMLVTRAEGGHVDAQECVHHVVSDRVAGEGPLRGVLTALECSTTESLIAIPIDMPGLRAEHLVWLLEQGQALGSERTLLGRTMKGLTKIEPFPSFYQRRGTEPIRQLLAARRFALRELATLAATNVVDAPAEWDDEVWMNMNTPADAARFVTTLGDTTTTDADG